VAKHLVRGSNPLAAVGGDLEFGWIQIRDLNPTKKGSQNEEGWHEGRVERDPSPRGEPYGNVTVLI
jgi:hypothetical protein